MTEPANRVDLSQLDDFEAVGQGGSAVVYRASCSESGRELAVKVFGVPGTEPSYSADRFDREAAVMRELSQLGGFVPIESSGHLKSGRPYLVMPFYAAGSLQDRLRATGALDWEEGLDVVEQLAQAMELAHARRIFHRDLKPANVLVDDDGRPAISDFGISQVEREDAPTVSVSISGPVLTPVYSPPEAFADEGAESATQDVYGLGATLWALLAGRAPFTSDQRVSLMTVVGRILNDPVGDLRPAVPDPVCQLIEASMAKNPADRPQTMTEFLVQLRAVRPAGAKPSSEPSPAVAEVEMLRPVSVGPVASAPHGRGRPRGPRAVLGTAAAVAIVVSLVGAMGFGSPSAELAKAAGSSELDRTAEGVDSSAGLGNGAGNPTPGQAPGASGVDNRNGSSEPGATLEIGTDPGSSDEAGFEGLTAPDDLMLGDGFGDGVLGDGVLGDGVPGDGVLGDGVPGDNDLGNADGGAAGVNADGVSAAAVGSDDASSAQGTATGSSGTPTADASGPATPPPADPSVDPPSAPTTTTVPTTTAPTTTTPANPTSSSTSTTTTSSPQPPPGGGGPGHGGGPGGGGPGHGGGPGGGGPGHGGGPGGGGPGHGGGPGGGGPGHGGGPGGGGPGHGGGPGGGGPGHGGGPGGGGPGHGGGPGGGGPGGGGRK